MFCLLIATYYYFGFRKKEKDISITELCPVKRNNSSQLSNIKNMAVFFYIYFFGHWIWCLFTY